MQFPYLVLAVLIGLPLVCVNSGQIEDCGLANETMRSICSGRYPQETAFLFFLPLVKHLDLYSIYVSEKNDSQYLLLLFDAQPYGCDRLEFRNDRRGLCHSTGARFAAANPHTMCVNSSYALLDHLLMMCSTINLDRREFPESTTTIIFYTDVDNDDGIIDPRDFNKASSVQSNIYAFLVVGISAQFLNFLC